MNTENVTPVSDELSSPRFDTLATNRAHPVVPLSNTSQGMRGRGGLLSGIRHARPAVLVVAAILATVIVAAATAIYKHQQSALVTGSAQGVDSNAPAVILPAEISNPVPEPLRRANVRSTSIPLRRVEEPAGRAEVLGTIRQILQERSRSRGEREEKNDRRGKQGDKHGGKNKRGGQDGDDH
ncbi:MAG: hypothetical protein ABI596_03555 [Pyrinomonadaceae bacterium]